MSSHNINDIKEKYCGKCRKHHSDIIRKTVTVKVAAIEDLITQIETEQEEKLLIDIDWSNFQVNDIEHIF